MSYKVKIKEDYKTYTRTMSNDELSRFRSSIYYGDEHAEILEVTPVKKRTSKKRTTTKKKKQTKVVSYKFKIVHIGVDKSQFSYYHPKMKKWITISDKRMKQAYENAFKTDAIKWEPTKYIPSMSAKIESQSQVLYFRKK